MLSLSNEVENTWGLWLPGLLFTHKFISYKGLEKGDPSRKMVPRGQYSEHRLATMSRNDYEASWNRQTDGQDHVLSQADALTKNLQKF